MKVGAFEEPQYQFLLHVFEAYTRGGLPAGELGIAASTFQRVAEMREVPVEQLLSQAKVTGLGPNAVALEVPAGSDVHDPEPR